MPAGAAFAPGRVPGGLAGFGGFPEGKVGGIAFAGAFDVAQAGFLLFDFAMRELAVIGIGFDVEVDVSIDGVGVIFFDELGAETDDLADVLGGLGKIVDGVDAQRCQALVIFGRVFGGEGID